MQSINDLSGYEINSADRWEPFKSLIIGPGALLKRALTIPTASPQGCRYKAPTQSVKRYEMYKHRSTSWFFTIFIILTLASETLWQAPHRWPSLSIFSRTTKDSIRSLLLTILCIINDWWKIKLNIQRRPRINKRWILIIRFRLSKRNFWDILK